MPILLPSGPTPTATVPLVETRSAGPGRGAGLEEYDPCRRSERRRIGPRGDATVYHRAPGVGHQQPPSIGRFPEIAIVFAGLAQRSSIRAPFDRLGPSAEAGEFIAPQAESSLVDDSPVYVEDLPRRVGEHREGDPEGLVLGHHLIPLRQIVLECNAM